MAARGFTMIEVLAVLVVLGLAAGVVAVNVRSPIHKARKEQVVGQVVDFDARARAMARRRHRALRLQVEVNAGRLICVDAETGRESGSPAVLAAGWRIDELRFAYDRVAAGIATVGISGHGLSPSYAILLTGPGDRRQWLLSAGLTGEFTEHESDEEIENVLSETSRDHAG